MDTYHDEQRVDQSWLWVLTGGVVILSWVVFIQDVVMDSDGPTDWWGVVLMLAFGVGLPLWLYSLRLVTTVDEEAVDARFKPALGSITVRHDEIATAEATEYHPIKEFGGWGVGWSSRGKAVNVSGNSGVRITTVDGKRYLIGSQTPDQLVAAISTYR